MKKLLGKQGMRMLEMITYLHTNDWVTLEKISEATGYSERTLREDIKYLNTILKPIEIAASTKLGVKLIIPQGYSFKFIHSLLLSDSLHFSLLEVLFLHTYTDIAELADAMYSSPTVVSKAIRQINQVIKEQGFWITTNPLAIQGDEQWITAYFRSYFLAKYDANLPLDQTLIEPIKEAIDQLHQAEGASILPMNRNLLVLYGVIRVFRMKQNSQNQYQREPSQEVYQESITTYNRRLSELAELTEVYDFFRDIWRSKEGNYTCFRIDEFHRIVQEKPAVRHTYEIYADLADQIENELGFHFNYKEWFIFNVYNIAVGEYYTVSILTDKSEYLLPNIKKLVPYLYLTVSRIAAKVAPRLDLTTDQLLYNVFSATDDFLTTGHRIQPKLKVAIYGKYNNIIVANNWNVIKNTFANRFDVRLIQSTFDDARQEINANYDLLITDINNIDIDIDYFCIAYDISAKEVAMLEAYYFDAMIAQVDELHQDD
ncbi:helix-turn-helix domain-containing protein [Vagococcus sp. BWB3-3]|uniref:Helix-turn-helix domain-containing protein n=1 Tax=Vagococcus allomyrinae TaxID=2794353 RepID=A0A940PFM0_9ENTE|nr:helix-turn-helix domain-containing protein [Vagococcus allomyrinae]MBP1043712.1 helix-turn-helix domain-containing protein [Vagococcus allomyrinae]